MQTPTTVASVQERSVFDTPSTVAIVDRTMIDRYGFRTVAEAINTLAGFATVRTSSRIDLPTSRWILQAHYADKVLLMINGVPVWQPVTGDTALGRVDIEDVDRIEVLRGPSSVQYGTNAYAGAINLVLRCQADPDTSSASLYGGAGTANALRGGGWVAVNDGPVDFFMAISTYDEHGDLRRTVDADDVVGWYRDFRAWSTVTAAARYKQHSLLFNGFRQRDPTLGRDPTFALGWGEPETLDGRMVNYTFSDQVLPRVALNAGLSFDWQRRIFAREAGFNFRTSVIGHRATTFVGAVIALRPWSKLEVGIDADRRTSVEYRSFRQRQNETVSESNLEDRVTHEGSAYAQVDLQRSGLGVVAGARATYNQGFGANLSGRATGVYAIERDQSVKLIVGQSYRAPSLFELYFLNPERTTSGNPDLRPETSTSIELAYLTSLRGVFLQALGYYAIYDGAIYRAGVPAGTVLADGAPSVEGVNVRMYGNGEVFTAAGLELEVKAELGPVSSFGTYTYVRGLRGDDDRADYSNFKFVPAHKAVLGAAVTRGGAFASLAGVYVSKMEGSVPDAGGSTRIDGQLTLAATVGYDHELIGHPVHHLLTAKNLGGTATTFPDYVDLVLKEVPYDQTRRVLYTVRVDF